MHATRSAKYSARACSKDRPKPEPISGIDLAGAQSKLAQAFLQMPDTAGCQIAPGRHGSGIHATRPERHRLRVAKEAIWYVLRKPRRDVQGPARHALIEGETAFFERVPSLR